MDITDINNPIHAAATIIKQTLNEPSKRNKNGRKVKFWKIRKQKQISSWRKELSTIAESGTDSDCGKLNRKKRKVFQKYRVTQGIFTVDRNTEAESASKSPKNQKV